MTHERTARYKEGATARLDEGFLLFAGEATVAVEALALAFAIVETTVGAVGELREVAEVVVVVDLGDGGGNVGVGKSRGNGEGTSSLCGDVNFEEVLHASLAGNVAHGDPM